METMGRVFTVLGDFDRADPSSTARSRSEASMPTTTNSPSPKASTTRPTSSTRPGALRRGRGRRSAGPSRSANVENRRRSRSWPRTSTPSATSCGTRAGSTRPRSSTGAPSRFARRPCPDDHVDIAQSLHNLGCAAVLRGRSTPRPSGSTAGPSRSRRRPAAGTTTTSPPASTPWPSSIRTRTASTRLSSSNWNRWRSARRSSVPDHPHVALSLTTLGNIYR